MFEWAVGTKPGRDALISDPGWVSPRLLASPPGVNLNAKGEQLLLCRLSG